MMEKVGIFKTYFALNCLGFFSDVVKKTDHCVSAVPQTTAQMDAKYCGDLRQITTIFSSFALTATLSSLVMVQNISVLRFYKKIFFFQAPTECK